MAIEAVGDDEENTAAGELRELLHDNDHGVPEKDGVAAGAVLLVPKGDARGDGGVQAALQNGGVRWFVVGGSDEGTIDGVDGDAVVRAERLCGPCGEALAEDREEGRLVAADIEKDGEGDGVVTFETDAVGAEEWAGVDVDVEGVGIDGGKRLEVGAEDEGGDLHETGVDVQDVARAVRRRGWGGLGWGGLGRGGLRGCGLGAEG